MFQSYHNKRYFSSDEKERKICIGITNPIMLKSYCKDFLRIYDNFDSNFGIKNNSLKYFVMLFLFSKFWSSVSGFQTTISEGSLQQKWVNRKVLVFPSYQQLAGRWLVLLCCNCVSWISTLISLCPYVATAVGTLPPSHLSITDSRCTYWLGF